MTKRVRSSVWVVGLLGASRLFAQSTPLTLADCQHLAESVPSAYSVARTEAQVARAGVGLARANFLPNSTFASGYTYNSPRAGDQTFIALNGVREYQAISATSLEIDTSGRLRAALSRAKADRDIADANSLVARRDLRRQVATSYFRTLLARHLVDAAEASLMEASSFRQRAQQLLAGGEVARADVVKADSQVAFLQQVLTAAELEAQLANQELAAFWTDDVNTRLSLEDSLIHPVPPDDAVRQPGAFLHRPEFNLYEAQTKGFRADYRRERANLFPQLGLVFQYGLDAQRLRLSDRGSATFLTINFPIFDFFRIRETSRQFALRAEQTAETRSTSVRTFTKDYEAALARVRLIWQQIATTDTQIKTSEENLSLARTRYEGGEGPALDVVAAQQQLQQARTNYFTVLSDYANARADLEVTSGK